MRSQIYASNLCILITNVQSAEVLQVYPAPSLVELIGRGSELVGERRCKVIGMLDGMRHLLVADVFTTARQDICAVSDQPKTWMWKRILQSHIPWLARALSLGCVRIALRKGYGNIRWTG